MSRIIWAIARSDVTRWRRSPALVAATLIPAIGMSLTVLGLTYAVGRQPVALVRLSEGPTSDKVVKILRESDGFFLTERTAEEAAEDLRDQWVCAVITIPEDFDAAFATNSAHVDVAINNVDLDFSDDIRRSVSEAVVKIAAPELASLGEEGDAEAGESEEEEAAEEGGVAAPAAVEAGMSPTLVRHGNEWVVVRDDAGQPADGEAQSVERIPYVAPGNPYRVRVVETALRYPDISFLAYQMVPVLALMALTAGALVTALSIAGDREAGRLRVMRLTPASRLGIVLGHLAGGTLAATLLLAIVVIPLAVTGVLAPPPGRWPVIAALLVATAVGSTGLGVLVGLVTQRLTTTVLLGVNVASASFLLGGGFTTIAFLPPYIQHIAAAVPSFYAVEGLREALFYAEMPTLARNLAVLTGTAALSVLAGVWMLASSRVASR
jgi:ABC-type multidrug transport system permease subunit